MTHGDASPVDELVAAFLAAAERGQAPDPADWLARHPDHAADLAAFLADLGRFGSFLGLPDVPNHDLTADFEPGAPNGEPRERFGGYELLREIGRGTQGIVYRARLKGTSLEVALKLLRGRGFPQELDAAPGLRHPNIVPVYHVGEHDGRPFYTMALVEGGSLDHHIARFKNDPRAAAVLVAKVARAIHFAHQRRVLHRDLKPANILLDEAGEPHVADFGLAARMDDSGTTTDAGPAAGSLPWMAPEAVRGDAILTTGVDVYALGVILYELLTGARPFKGATWAELRAAVLAGNPTAPRVVNPRVPLDIDAICRRCLAREPDRRYESASAVALELERWLRDEPVRARPTGRGERVARWCRRNPGVAAGAVFGIALLVAVTAGSITLVGELESEIVSRDCANSEYDAALVAGNVQQRFEELGGAVQQKVSVFAAGNEFPAGSTQAAEQALHDLVNDRVGGVNAAPFVNAFLLDPSSRVRVSWPPDPKTGTPDALNLGFIERDYFVRAREGRVHVSRVFRSRRDGLDKLALSIRFQLHGSKEWWVLAATVTTDRKLDLGVVSMSDSRHEAILVAPRDDAPVTPGRPEPGGYVILVHQALDPRSPPPHFGASVPGPARDNGLPELGPSPPGEARPFPPDRDYRDPLAESNPAYAGRWLTGSARVGNTELVVVVQQRYSDAWKPHRSLLRRSLTWLGAAVAVGLVAFAALRLMRSPRFQ
jgi:eukaryotic-like serine/threonine-protein kinase